MQPEARSHPGKSAFDQIADQRATIDSVTLLPYNLDATYAVAHSRAIAGRLAPFRAVLLTLPGFDIGHLDRFALYADALEFLHAELVSRVERVRKLPEVASEGYTLRSVLMAYGDLLAMKGRFPASVIARLRQGSGYRDLIEDLNALVTLYQRNPDVLAEGAPVRPDEIDRAAALARQLSIELGTDRDMALSQDEIVKERQKVAHLLITAHRELRRAIQFIRFYDGDAAALVPSLHHLPPRARGTAGPAPASELDAGPAVAQEDGPFVDADV